MFFANSVARTMAPGGMDRCAPGLFVGSGAAAALADARGSGDPGTAAAHKITSMYPNGVVDQDKLVRSLAAVKVDSFAPGSAKISYAMQGPSQGTSFTISTVTARYSQSVGSWQFVVDGSSVSGKNESTVATLPEGMTLWL